MAEAAKKTAPGEEEKELSDVVRAELETMTSTERAAVIMLLMGETQASDIIRYLNPREVQAPEETQEGNPRLPRARGDQVGDLSPTNKFRRGL